MTPTGHAQSDYRINVDGRDITAQVDPRLISLTLTECRGGEADQLELVLDDADAQLELPPKGAVITVQIGWRGQALADKGSFVVDEIEHSGAPDQLHIRARSADMIDALKVRAEKSWHQTTVGEILDEVAKQHGLTPCVEGKLALQAIDHIDQTHESDLNFVTRLARRYDAVATVKKGRLLFLPINGTTSSTGESLAAVKISRADGDNHRFHTADREAYSGVRAYWHDTGKAQRRGVLVGVSGNAKRLRDTYANEQDALAAAKAEWQRIQRGAATLELTLALGRPELMPQTPVRVTGFKPAINAIPWLTLKTAHSLSESGLTTRVEFETETSVTL